MGILGKIFGTNSAPALTPQPPTMAEMVRRDIETTEGELADAEAKLALAGDAEIKASLELLVTRKTQAVADLQEKLRYLEQNKIS